MASFSCPRCAGRLVHKQRGVLASWSCDQCAGMHITLEEVKRHSSDLQLHELLVASEEATINDKMRCGVCHRAMASFHHGAVPLDVCKGCQVFWLDPGEEHSILAEPPTSTGRFGGPRERKGQVPNDLDRWEFALAFMGLPVEYEAPELRRRPVVTWGLLLVLIAVWLIAQVAPEAAYGGYGFVPADALRLGGLTMISSAFLHSGLVHLAGNTYFLWLFGDNVEDVLGPLRLGGLMLGAHIMGMAAHGMWGPDPTVPCVGASAAISGLMIFYALRFRKAKIALFGLWTFFRFRAIPAWLYLCIWVGLQFLVLADQLSGGQTSALAHFGGATVGIFAWLLWGRDTGSKG